MDHSPTDLARLDALRHLFCAHSSNCFTPEAVRINLRKNTMGTFPHRTNKNWTTGASPHDSHPRAAPARSADRGLLVSGFATAQAAEHRSRGLRPPDAIIGRGFA